MNNETKTTILTIDDEVSIRESFAAHLEDEGYRTLIAEDGSKGLEIFRREHPDLVLVDLRMKEVDGLEVLEQVVKESPETPIIVVSGTGNIHDAIYALRLGAWNYLLKPIEDMSVLTHAVEKSLERARLINESREHQRHLEVTVDERTRELRLSNEELILEIKERKQTEKALLQERDRAQKYLDIIGVMLVVIDPDQTVSLINKKGIETLGYEEGDITGKNWFDNFLPEKLRDQVKSVFDKLMTDEIEVQEYYENPVLTKRGEERMIAWRNTILKSSKGEIIGTLSSGEDITERKNLESQLIQAQKMESIGTLAGGIAHDFNNIISAIIGFIYLAKMKLPEGIEGVDYLDQVMKAVNRAADLVKQILTFSRTGDQGLQPVIIEPTVKEALKLLSASIPSTIEIKQNISPTSHVMADPTQIYQIVMNLCTNAYHAMLKTRGVLEIDLQEINIDPEFASQHVDLNPGLYVKLTISDTGQGIDPAIINKIFEPYFTTKEKGKGTGLGLSVVHGIVKRHGGTITVASELSKGTTFQIYLPVISSEAATEAKTDQALIKGTETVLLVDDEKSIKISVTELLESMGYKVTGTTDSREALEMFRKDPDKFDLVLTDMTMPKMTGLALSSKILNIRSDIPIILSTGFAEGVDEEMVKQAGIRDLLMKPFSPVKLSQTIRKALDKNST